MRTVQTKHAIKEFENLQVSVEEALALAKAGNHSGLRKWTLANEGLIANFYKMGPNVHAMARYMAVLAQPSQVGDRFVAFHEKDASSGNLQEDTQLVGQQEAAEKIESLMVTLKEKQAETSGALENNEIQTLGFSPSAVTGLLYKAGGGFGGPKDWASAKADFQKVVNGVGALLDGGPGEYHVFTYVTDETSKKTTLQYLDTLSPQK